MAETKVTPLWSAKGQEPEPETPQPTATGTVDLTEIINALKGLDKRITAIEDGIRAAMQQRIQEKIAPQKAQEVPIKKKGGRPKGSKNKKKTKRTAKNDTKAKDTPHNQETPVAS